MNSQRSYSIFTFHAAGQDTIRNFTNRINILILFVLAVIVLTRADASAATNPLPIDEVHYWAYQIQDIASPGAVDALADSQYDMLVIEPTRTDYSEIESRDFDTHAMVQRLKNTTASDCLHRKLVIAYIDIGQAEEWRWYWTWSKGWQPPDPFPADWPNWIVAPDPDGWSGNYSVAFWDAEWQDITIHGQTTGSDPFRNYTSIIDETIKDGFDGIYLDWVEAFDDTDVLARAAMDGVNAEDEMISFIGVMRTYARSINPDFLIIQQNAPSLIDGHPELLNVIDAIAGEDTWYLGMGDAEWQDPAGYDTPQDPTYQAEVLGYFDDFQNGNIPIFIIDYTVTHAADVYQQAYNRGYIPYCSRVALSQLTTTPPPGLNEGACDANIKWFLLE